jgi:DNA replication protein DnaC|tara:strand:- start:522 stop:1280 length:759 start_codon:yes stop_codon:yes gene_type:complete
MGLSTFSQILDLMRDPEKMKSVSASMSRFRDESVECNGVAFDLVRDDQGIEYAIPKGDTEEVKEDKLRKQIVKMGLARYADVTLSDAGLWKFEKKELDRYGLQAAIQDGKTLLFRGPVGTGKTYLAIALIKDLLVQKKKVALRRWPKLLQEMLDTFKADLPMSSVLDPVLNADVLLLDEINIDIKGKASAFEIGKLADIISDFHGSNRGMILTTNLSEPKIQELYGKQIWSRLTDKERSIIVSFQYERNRRN